MKKRNKTYRPKPVNASALNWALAGVHLIPESMQEELMQPVDEAMELLRQGNASRDDWNFIANALNIGEAFAFIGVGMNLQAEIQAGIEAMDAVARRMIDTGSSTCKASELMAIREGIFMYQAMLKACTQAELSKAVKRVHDMHRSGAMLSVAA